MSLSSPLYGSLDAYINPEINSRRRIENIFAGVADANKVEEIRL
jgi:hypothetical protein